VLLISNTGPRPRSNSAKILDKKIFGPSGKSHFLGEFGHSDGVRCEVLIKKGSVVVKVEQLSCSAQAGSVGVCGG